MVVQVAAAQRSAVVVAATVASSCILVVLLDAWLLAKHAEGQGNVCHDEACNLRGALCQQLYSCNVELQRARPPKLKMGCSCHNYCHVAGDCCADKAPPPASLSPTPPAHAYDCVSFGSFAYSLRMVTACPSPAVDAQVANLCTTPISIMPQPDALSTPVTDRASGLTYRNIYCAQCWGIASQHVSPWLWKFVCDYEHFNIYYPDDLLIPVELAESSTRPSTKMPEPDMGNASAVVLRLRELCPLMYTPPPDLLSITHNCTPNVLDSCADSTADEESQRRCVSGAEARVYLGSTAYKNAACAACSTDAPSYVYRCAINDWTSGIVRNHFDVLLSSMSGCCFTVNGGIPSSRAWPFPWLCQDQNRCSSADATTDYAAATLPDAAFPTVTFEDKLRRRHSNASGSCIYSKNLRNFATSVNFTYATFVNDTLVLIINETAALCVSCLVRRCTHFTATNRSLECAADGQLYHYDYPFFVVEGENAVACGSARMPPSNASLENDAGCSAIPEAVTVVSLIASEVCLIGFFTAFALVKTLRQFPQEFLFNQSVAFFVAFLLFMLRPVASDSHCSTLAAAIHYFLVCAFAWTTLFAIQITRVLSSVPLRSARSHFRWRLASYTFGWILPLVCVGLGLAADAGDLDFKPDYGPPQCFISNPLGSVVLFVAPLALFLLVDVTAYSYMIVRLIKVARQTALVRKSHSEKLFLCVKLVLCLGLLWISGIVAVFTRSQAAYCTFTLLNTWQGVFTFIVFVCKRDILMSFKRRPAFHRMLRSVNVSSVTTTSSIVATRSIATDL